MPKAKHGDYRIRWANVSHGNGHRITHERMCIAERKTRWLGWWPVIDGEWRFLVRDAERDIDHDRSLRAPLPVPMGERADTGDTAITVSWRIAALLIVFVLGGLASYGLARAGEPSSAWLWGLILG